MLDLLLQFFMDNRNIVRSLEGIFKFYELCDTLRTYLFTLNLCTSNSIILIILLLIIQGIISDATQNYRQLPWTQFKWVVRKSWTLFRCRPHPNRVQKKKNNI